MSFLPSRNFCSSSEGEDSSEEEAADADDDDGDDDCDDGGDDEEALMWGDAEDIAELLFEAAGTEDPLQVRFTDLRQRVCDLPTFGDAPDGSSEGKLEAIQLAWLELYEDEHGPSPSR